MAKIHSTAEVQTKSIGKNTLVWQNCVILSRAKIGDHCNINFNVFIENDVVIGNNVTIKSGVQVWDGISIEDDVFIGPNATFTNDKVPRSKQYPEEFPRSLVKKGASIGANATILPGIIIGRFSMVGAGAVVTKDVPDFSVVIGNPAKLVGYITKDGTRLNKNLEDDERNKYHLVNDDLIRND